MEVFLQSVLPRLLPEDATFEIHAFQGKSDLLSKLEDRLRGYARWLPPHWHIVVLVDRDSDDCRKLKARLERMAYNSGLLTRSQRQGQGQQITNRIVIEELEAWYFGDWDAVCAAYPRLNSNLPRQARYRDPDCVRGGTWEAFERILKRQNYFTTGLRKSEAARAIAPHICPDRNRSGSFKRFVEAVSKAATSMSVPEPSQRSNTTSTPCPANSTTGTQPTTSIIN